MKKIFSILILGTALLGLASCNWENDFHYDALAPITITAVSDTINTNVNEKLEYDAITVESELEVTYEWAYGRLKKDTSFDEHEFETVNIISDNAHIDYAFKEIGSYLLRLKVDNGESIAVKYFTLNVNAGFDEGLAILSNKEDGSGILSFIKTLTKDEMVAGKQKFYEDIFKSINTDYELKNGKDLYLADLATKNGTFAKFLISTNDDKGRIYLLDGKTMAVLTTTNMKELYNTTCREFGGPMLKTSGFANYFVGEDNIPYRYDMEIGFIQPIRDHIKDLDVYAEHTYEGIYENLFKSPYRIGFWWSKDYIMSRSSAGGGIKYLKEDGWEIFNIVTKRSLSTFSDPPIIILMQNIADRTQFKVKYSSSDSFSRLTEGISFKTDDIKMDRDSKLLNTKSSSDVYYVYDNAIYRWGLVTAPATEPTITLPEGEQITSICTNYMGKIKDGGGEDKLYVATYNPDRAGDYKGSLYIYNFEDNTLIESYEGKFYKPSKVYYKYRVN